MISIAEIQTGIRDYLLYPDYARLPKSTVLLRIHDKADYYRTALSIVNRGWLVDRWNLNVDTARTEFPVTASNWGRPFLAVTKDDADPNFIEREVEIVAVQNRDLFYQGARQGSVIFAAPHVASCLAFFNDADQGWRALVTPQHTQNAQYQVWFTPDRPMPPVLADNFNLIESFVNLFKVDVALSCLPNILIIDDDGNVTNAAQVAMVERRLTADFALYKQQFDIYKQFAFNDQTGQRRGWADNSDSETYFF